jgi:formylglycine-generating enzyme required for sulfatase activity
MFTIRSDNYERLQLAKELESVRQQTLSLPPMPRGAYAEVIKGPAQRLEGTSRPLRIDDAVVDALLTDIEAGGAKDALPLLAFTLERLYGEYGATGHLMLDHYEKLGRIEGSIEAAVERAFKDADRDPRVPKDRQMRQLLLRRGLIPWLAGIDPDTGAPRRRVARLSEIPAEARPLVDLLIAQRLLSTDVAMGTKETTIEPAHEALLRQWNLLQGWLKEDAALLTVLDGIKRSARDWVANGKANSWLAHADERLRAAERLLARPDLAANLEPTDKRYVASCRHAEQVARARARRNIALVSVLTSVIIVGLIGLLNQSYLQEQIEWFATIRPYKVGQVQPHLLTAEAEGALKPGDFFRECAKDCPEMVVVPAGEFMLGSPPSEVGRYTSEGPRKRVAIARFAVSKFEVTFADWEVCVKVHSCGPKLPDDKTWAQGERPVINVSWDEAQKYVDWFSKMTGKTYRLLTEAEWEYAARARTTTRYSFGDDVATIGEYAWYRNNSDDMTHRVGGKKANEFGLYDMHGNVFEWVQDCWHDDYNGAPADSSAWTTVDCSRRVARGGSWKIAPEYLRSANRRPFLADLQDDDLGFRIARTLLGADPILDKYK